VGYGHLRLQGKRAVVTGAGSGIGAATALLFAREGASVALVGRTVDKLSRVAAQILDAGGRSLVLPADVTDEPAMEGVFRTVADTWGGLDSCVAVAGIEQWGKGDDRVDRLELTAWKRIVENNLTGMFITCKHAIRAMLRTGGGSLVVTGSPTGTHGFALGEDAYSASKAGCHGLARVMANEYARDGIRVNCVVPGFIDTPINAAFLQDLEAVRAFNERIPSRRVGHAEEVAAMNLWLCSDESSYAVGGFFVVDGGLTAV
jgi:NAD(P)-dependent dehydrogenase (short-subunit alcohol dehydrogenase family)